MKGLLGGADEQPGSMFSYVSLEDRDAALVMVERLPGRHRVTVAADKG
jgi:hypothetical protein